MENTVEGYLNRVKRDLRHSGDKNLRFYGVFSQEVVSYLAEKPQASIEELEQYFGSPTAVVDNFLETLPDDVVRKKCKKRKRVSYLFRIAVVVLLVALVGFIAFRVYDGYKYSHGHFARVIYEDTTSASTSTTENFIESY